MLYSMRYCIRYGTLYQEGLPSEAVLGQIKWVAPRFGPAIEKLALPLNGSKGVEVTLGTRLFSKMALSSPTDHAAGLFRSGMPRAAP